MSDRVAWVTGARGFVASHLVKTLRDSGWTVVGFVRDEPGTASADHLPFSAAGFREAVARFAVPRRVFHLAGGATVGRSLADPIADFNSNVVSTATLLDAVRQNCPDSLVVLASSAAIYGGAHIGPILTDAPAQANSPYGHHKLMAEQLALSYAESFDIHINILRFFSIYGPALRKQLLFDICTKLNMDATHLRLGGTGDEIRDWCHVADAVLAMIGLEGKSPQRIETFNVGTGTGMPIRAVAQHMVDAWGAACEIEFTGQSRPGDPFSLVAAPTSLPPGFAPQISPAAGFQSYVEWFKKAEGVGAAR